MPTFELSKTFIAFRTILLPFFHFFVGFLECFARVSSSPEELSEKSLELPKSLSLLSKFSDEPTKSTGAVEGPRSERSICLILLNAVPVWQQSLKGQCVAICK